MGGLTGRSRGAIGPLPISLLALLFILPGLAAAGGRAGEGGTAARAAYYELSISPANATQWVNASTPQKSATYGFQVRNAGNTSLPNCDLQLYPWTFPPEKWSYNFIPSAPFEIDPNDPPRTILLVIYPPADAEAKRYTFQLKGKGASVATNSISINLDVRQYAGVLVVAPPERDATPGEALEFNFTIVNTGNGRDRFQVAPVEILPSTLQGNLQGNSSWTPQLAPGAGSIMTVVVMLPFDMQYSPQGYEIQLAAVSELDSTCSDINFTYFRIKRIHDLSIGIDPPSLSILPGQEAGFSITVVNTGNGNDSFTLSFRPLFPSAAWILSLGQDRLVLPAGNRAITTLRVTPPHDALAGDTYAVELVVLSSGTPGDAVKRTEYLFLTVLPVKGISVPREHFPSPHQVAPGGAVQYSFNFTNTGNAPATVRISVPEAPPGWSAAVEPQEAVAVRPGATVGALLKVAPSARFNESPAGTHLVKVRLSDPEGNILRELTFETEVAPVRAMELEPMGGPSSEVNLFVSNRETVLLWLENTGNAPDQVHVALGGDYASWGRFDASFVPVGAGEMKVLRLDITVPRTASTVSIYPLTIKATSLGRPDLFVERLLFITVKSFDPADLAPRLKVYPESRSLALTGGDEITFSVSVLCTGSGIGNVSLRITGGEELGLTCEISELPRNLSAGENHTFLVVIRAGGPGRTVARGTLVIQAVGQGGSAAEQTVSFTLQPASRSAPVVSMEGLGIALAIFLSLGGIAVGWNEVVLVALLNLLLPLYVKLRREEVLDQYTRGKIHGYIIANPGEHYNSIKAQLRLKNGTLAYHLRVLEREGYVKTSRDGMFKRFYPMESLVPRRKSEFSAIQEIVLETIRSSPGITQNELARRMGVSSQVVNYHIRNLVAAGAVSLEREGRITRCHLN